MLRREERDEFGVRVILEIPFGGSRLAAAEAVPAVSNLERKAARWPLAEQ
ncbi:hypothetical protein GGR19_002497 [Croceicoccus naphthovorans]|jgi:hypothetical protein|nr:hypothetical protein [Croceicoccus naphthovorans]